MDRKVINRKASLKYYNKNKENIIILRREYYKRNRDIILERKKQYRIRNNEKIRQIERENYKNNRQHILQLKRNLYLTNPNIKLKSRELRFKNIDRYRKYYIKYNNTTHNKLYRSNWKKKNILRIRNNNAKYSRIKRITDYNFLISGRIRNRIRTAFRLYSSSGKILNSKQYGIDYQAIIEHLKPFPENIKDYHIDHIKPLCSFSFVNQDGSTNLEEVKMAFSPENHQWLLAKDNMIKGGKYNEKEEK